MGRSTFELAREYEEVVGVDFSQAFVEVCHTLKLNGEIKYSLPVEGDLVENKIATIDPAIVSTTIDCLLPPVGQGGRGTPLQLSPPQKF